MANALFAFHFLRPTVLWAFVPFALYAFALYFRASKASPWRRAIDPHLLERLMTDRRLRAWFTPDAALVPLAALAVLAAAGPTWAPQAESGDPAHSPLAIVMELSHSMGGTDVSPSRAERARLELRDLLHARPASPTSLVVVAGSAHVLMPMTDDPAVLETYIAALAPDLMPSDGEAFARAAKLIEPMAAAAKAPLSVLLVSDGVPPNGAAALAELHEKRGVGFVILAVGGSKGDPAHNAPALDRAGLDRFADRVGAEVIELSFGERDVTRILRAVALNRARSLARSDAEFWEDSAYLFAIPLALGVALWFRRGWAVGRLALSSLLLLSGCSGRVADIWLSPDQQGHLLFEQGRYQEAATRFQDPMWRGLSLYAQGKFADAAGSFAAIDTKEGLYNLGNAYAQGGKLGSALAAYQRALAKAPTFREARHNADLMRELIASQHEDTDQEDMNKQEQNHGDAATRLDQDQIAFKSPPVGSKERPVEPDALSMGPAEEAAWLRHVDTDPAEFLKRKLATLAARGTP
ncbi:MAG: VWA domain-containing protein [Pseudomonadota bacterium]